jgi:hypothetical protein
LDNSGESLQLHLHCSSRLFNFQGVLSLSIFLRHCERSDAIQIAAIEVWIASSLSLLAMTHFTVPATRTSGFCRIHPALGQPRAQGMPGAPIAPAASCEKEKTHEQSHHRHTGNHPAFPARMVLTVSFVVSPETGLDCLRHRRNFFADLIPASGYQDRTTSPSASRALVSCASRVHRIPHPTSVTIAKRPSDRGGTGRRSKAASS